ncbi:hypothetical protein L484_008788 [Morus notabilis]|uniref:Uncharacterized protein n=1 Tax=Morus notabilis TaxID=981085 RepID=W9SGX7_9ROSA|nr:hypothetical protein L484_008788 [Morus notabilis]
MQCMNTSLVTTTYPSKLRARNSQLSTPGRQPHFQSNSRDKNGELFESVAANISLPSHVKSITSTSNPFVKHCLKLRHSSSYRHAHGSALVVGATPLRAIGLPSIHQQWLTILKKTLNLTQFKLLFCFKFDPILNLTQHKLLS